jgi:uroporphyrinogen decarboxylase
MAALNHQEPDRVPLDIGGGGATSIVVEGYERLKCALGIRGETRIMNKVFRVAFLEESVMQRLGSDCRFITGKPGSRLAPACADENTFTDVWGVTYRKAYYGDGCHYWELASSPLADATIEDLDRYPWPDPLDPSRTAGLAEEAKALYENTAYALVGDGGFKSFWELAWALRGLEQMLTDLVVNPEFVTALLDKLLRINIAATGPFLDAAGRYIQVFRTGDDVAAQTGLLMSAKTYRTLLKPVYKKYLDFVRSKTEAKIFYHSCGNITDLIDDLVEIGITIINPVQVSAMGDTAALKARFGSKVTFWGGIDTQHVLPQGSVADVECEVRRRIHDLGPSGGFVVAAVHNIQPDVPPENILALADAVRKFGTYPLAV